MDNTLPNKLKSLYKIHNQIEQLNDEKNKIKTEIEELIIKNKLIDKKFSVGNLLITYRKNNVNQTLTQQYVSQCLEKYYANKPEEAEAILSYILDNRQKKSKYNLEIKNKIHDKNTQ